MKFILCSIFEQKLIMVNYKKTLKLVDQIQKIRSNNNESWMAILKLALKKDPKNTSKILSKSIKMIKKYQILQKKF